MDTETALRLDNYYPGLKAAYDAAQRDVRFRKRMRLKALVRRWTPQAIAERKRHPYSKRQLRALNILPSSGSRVISNDGRVVIFDEWGTVPVSAWSNL